MTCRGFIYDFKRQKRIEMAALYKWTTSVASGNAVQSSVRYMWKVKAVFQLRVFLTHIHARKSLNQFQYYI